MRIRYTFIDHNQTSKICTIHKIFLQAHFWLAKSFEVLNVTLGGSKQIYMNEGGTDKRGNHKV